MPIYFQKDMYSPDLWSKIKFAAVLLFLSVPPFSFFYWFLATNLSLNLIIFSYIFIKFVRTSHFQTKVPLFQVVGPTFCFRQVGRYGSAWLAVLRLVQPMHSVIRNYDTSQPTELVNTKRTYKQPIRINNYIISCALQIYRKNYCFVVKEPLHYCDNIHSSIIVQTSFFFLDLTSV